MSVKSNKGVVTDGLTFCLDVANGLSYSGSGTTWTDLINGKAGTLTNGAVYNSDNAGSIRHDGVNDECVFTDEDYLDGDTENYSISVWARYNGPALTSTSTIEPIISKGTYNGSGGEWEINIRGGSINGFYFRQRGPSSFDNVDCTTDVRSTIEDGNFHMYTATIDWSAGEIRTYLDGVEVGSKTGGLSMSSNASSGSLLIGHYVSWWGAVDVPHVCFYKGKALTVAEIQQNYNAIKNRFV